MPHPPTQLSPASRHALRLFGGLIEEGRLNKGWTRDELAERIGVGLVTVRRLIRGEPGVAIGTYFEAAWLVGIPIFGQDTHALEREAARQDERLTLLPSRVRPTTRDVPNDDF